MSQFDDDRTPRKPEPGPGEAELKKVQDQEMHEMWHHLKDRLRKFFGRGESSGRYPPT